MPMGRTTQKNLVPMVMRTFDVLEAFRERPHGLTYKDVLKRFPAIPSASAHRILCSLEAAGYLRKDARTSRYTLGVKFIEMGHLTEKRQDLTRIARPFMEGLLAEFGENVNLIKLENRELVYLTTLEGRQSLRVTEMRSRRQCIHSSASGKILMAFMPAEELHDLLADLDLAPLTPNTITSTAGLMAELGRIKRQRHAVDAEENILGVSCVASVILNVDHEPVAAMSVSAPTFRLTNGKMEEIAARLIEVTRQISTEFFAHRDA